MIGREAKTRLEAVLREQGKTIGWLAKATGFTYKHCWCVATGREEGSLSFLRRCSEVLGVQTHRLVDDRAAVA